MTQKREGLELNKHTVTGVYIFILLPMGKGRRMVMKGTVKWFNGQKGYGFIVGEDGKEVFVHYSEIAMDGYKVLEMKQNVEYDVAKTEKGILARNVRVIG